MASNPPLLRAAQRSLLVALAAATLPAVALAAAKSPAAADVNRARLGHAVVPTAQAVNLTLDPSQSDYTGSVHIDLKVNAACDSFQLNARSLKVTSLALANHSGAVPATWNPSPLERITVHAGRRLSPGGYTLDIAFSNAFDARATGLYRMRSGDDWYAFTQFESDDARQAFPCWDEPEFKIPWRLTITAPSTVTVVGNTPGESRAAGDKQTVPFQQTPPMPSYLVAFAVGPFESVPITGLSVPGHIYTVKGQSALTGEAVRMTPPILAAEEKYFKRPYPFAKLDLISIPEYNFGAMENPGAVTFADRILSLDPKETTDAQRLNLAGVIAHELAHMWFGDLVTMKWWDDLWLNESFASWMGDKITDQVFPQFRMPIQELEGTARAYLEDNHLSTHAMRQRVDENVNLGQMADALAYQKGQSVLGMIESWMGPETFQKGVLDYVAAHEWGNAEAADLWKALSKAGGSDIGAVMSTFLDQPGVPIVTVETQPGGQLKLSQRRYLPAGETAPSPQLWKIPVVLRVSDGRETHTQKVLLAEASQTVRLEPAASPAWIYPNADERGYYHWSVPQEMLTTLSTTGRGALDDRERIGFIHNLVALLDDGTLHGDDYLTTLAAFGADPTPEVAAAALDGVQGIKLPFVTTELRGGFAVYVRRTFRPALERLGEAPKPDDSPAAAELRARLMATLGVDGRDDAMVKKGEAMAKSYLADPASVHPTLVDAALRLAAVSNDTSFYNECRRRFENAKTPVERRRFLRQLTNFHDPTLIDQTLRYVLEGPLRPQELMSTFRFVDAPEVREKLWPWAKENYDRIAAKIPPMFRIYLVYYAFGCTEERITAAKAFFSQPEHAPLGTDKELAQLDAQIGTCVGLREREGPRVARMLGQLVASGQ